MHDFDDPSTGHITAILRQSAGGDPAALNQVFPLVYDELRRLARRQLSGQPAGRTLTTTVLIHEAYLRLVDQRQARFEDRVHFYAYAARVMRAVLVDAARARSAMKRGGDRIAVPFDERDLPIDSNAELILAIDEALAGLGEVDPRLVRVVECRFFAGMSDEEAASALGVSDRTVRREWIKARTWLHGRLGSPDPPADGSSTDPTA